MTRYNYYRTPFRRLLGREPAEFWDSRLRAPLLALGTALLLVGLAWFLEAGRLAVADAEGATLAAQIAAAANDDREAKHLTAEITQLRAAQDNILSARRDAATTTNAIARLGNSLPSQTWLTGLEPATGGAWSISGRSTRVDEVGLVLDGLQHLDPRGTARLQSISSNAHSRMLDFSLRWETSS